MRPFWPSLSSAEPGWGPRTAVRTDYAVGGTSAGSGISSRERRAALRVLPNRRVFLVVLDVMPLQKHTEPMRQSFSKCELWIRDSLPMDGDFQVRQIGLVTPTASRISASCESFIKTLKREDGRLLTN